MNKKYYAVSFTMLVSLISNSRCPITFYVFTDDLEGCHRDALSHFIKTHGCEVYYIDVDITIFEGLAFTEQYPPVLYCKMIPHVFLPCDVERILYLDLDIIINGNLEDFYNRDLADKYLCACHGWRAFGANYLDEEFPVHVDKDAFNSGVVLYNLKRMRGDISLRSYLEWLDEYEKRTQRRQEQYEEWLMLNVLRGQIEYEKPYDYNYNINSHAVRLYVKYCERHSILPLKRIIHYQPCYSDLTLKKPWFYFDVFVCGKEYTFSKRIYELYSLWWSYARKVPEEIFESYRNMIV